MTLFFIIKNVADSFKNINSGFIPNNFDSVLNSPLTQIGINQASQFVDSMKSSYFSNSVASLKYYFAVNNIYVLRKLKVLLFPFNRSWSRKMVSTSNNIHMYLPPSEDVNAPDLYIPIMAFITYILLVTLIMGTSSQGFQPDVLGVTASSGLLTLAIEVIIIKIGIYLLSFPSIMIFDLISYCGYKFVGLTLILLGRWISWISFVIVFIIIVFEMAVFMVKTLRLIIPQPQETSSKSIRNYFLFGVAIMQGIFTLIIMLNKY